MDYRKIIAFAREHSDNDPLKLVLQQKRYPETDLSLVAQQLEGLKQAEKKWPSLQQCEGFFFPPRLNREQSSSEATAHYKATLIQNLVEKECTRIADLTGGMGIDSMAFAKSGDEASKKVTVDYVEQSSMLNEIMQYNCQALNLQNITCHCADSLDWLSRQNNRYDLIYMDPARRDRQGRKTAAFEECEPNILKHQDLLRQKSQWRMVKASPMIDLTAAALQLGDVQSIHIVALRGECKEVLFLCGSPQKAPRIHCVNITDGAIDDHSFTTTEEQATVRICCQAIGHYIYEPHAALMKGGPFKSICHWFGVEQLAPQTHLYTSDRYIADFPGRIFEINQPVQLKKKEIAKLVPGKSAHVITRNYPVEANALQSQLGLKEGGDKYIIATTVGTQHCGFFCTEIKR